MKAVNWLYLVMTVSRATVLLCVFYTASVHGWNDNTGKAHKWQLRKLARELMADAVLKVKQTVEIRKEHGRLIAYEIGFIMGQIREKYKMMMELYRISLNRYLKRTTFATPVISTYYPVDYFQKYEYMHLLEVEIDKLVDVLEKMNMKIEPYPILYEPALRAREDDEGSEEEKQRALEEAVKSRYREEYLMRKLNSPGQSTTKKRFVQKWPVPGTWSLEAY